MMTYLAGFVMYLVVSMMVSMMVGRALRQAGQWYPPVE